MTTVYYADRLKQAIDFSALSEGQKAPSDIDGVYDTQGNTFLFMEYKFADTQMSKGQAWMYEALCNQLECPAAVLHCVHMTPVGEIIAAENAVVPRMYYEGEWHEFSRPWPVKRVLEAWKDRWQ